MGVLHSVGAANHIWPMTLQASISRSEKCGDLSGSRTAAGRAFGICGFVALSDRCPLARLVLSLRDVGPAKRLRRRISAFT